MSHSSWRRSARFWRQLHAAFLWLAVDYNGNSRFPHQHIHEWFNRRWNPDYFAELEAGAMSAEYVPFVLAWINRMTKRYGPIVRDKEGPNLDWGQALCRQVYGLDWNRLIGDIDGPTLDDVHAAQEWEAGEIPEWVEREP